MAKKSVSKLEKRRKGIELVFDLMFWFMLIYTIIALFGGKTSSALLLALVTVLLFVCARLAHIGNMAAGILGLVVGVVSFFIGGIVGVALGILLIIDSFMYIMEMTKTSK